VIVGLVLFAIVFFQVPRAHAGSLPCTASPSEGPVGTTFTLTASGFSPNTTLFLYAVDPSGSGFSSQQTQGFGGTVRTDATGTATFTFTSRFQQYLQSTVVLPPTAGPIIDRELGPWTLVAQELGPGNATVNQANCRVMITGGGGQALGGAQLKVSPETGFSDTNFTLTGSGFGPGQVVNTWLSPPLGCDTFIYELDNGFYSGAAASAVSYRSARTDAAGNFATNVFANTAQFCIGTWSISAYGPGSGRGAEASFLVTGHPTPENGGTLISVSPSVRTSRDTTFTVTGSGFLPNEPVNCWFVRPEGNTREFPMQRANSAGQLSFTFSTNFDLEGEYDETGVIFHSHYSLGSLGLYHMTCKGQLTGSIAITTFMVIGGLSDP
jgi:hypothetical protein